MKSLLPTALAALLLAGCASPSTRMKAASPAAKRAIADAASQVRRCYRTPRVPSAARRIATRLLIRYDSDGSLLGLPILVWQQGVTQENQPYAGRMAEAARLAVMRCNPLRLPPELHATSWSELYLTFSPRLMA